MKFIKTRASFYITRNKKIHLQQKNHRFYKNHLRHFKKASLTGLLCIEPF